MVGYNKKMGEDTKEDLFPVEILKPTGLTDEMRANFNLMRDLGRHTIVDP